MSDRYSIEYAEQAERTLKRLDKGTAKRITQKIVWLAENASRLSHSALSGRWSGLFRIRAGNYRVIYDIDHETRLIRIIVIGHRRDIYDA